MMTNVAPTAMIAIKLVSFAKLRQVLSVEELILFDDDRLALPPRH